MEGSGRAVVARGFRAALITVAIAASFGALASCGGGEGCAGFISINASPAECQEQAERFGCSSFEVDGPSCGLLGCATCDDLG